MAPERTAAIEHLAQSYGEVADKLGYVGELLDTVAFWLRLCAVVLVVVGAVLVASAAYNSWNGYQGARARHKLLTQSQQIKRTGDEVHSAVTPGQPLYEKGQATTAGLVSALTVEQDCRMRRALAKLPMPNPSKPCALQTPMPLLSTQGGTP